MGERFGEALSRSHRAAIALDVEQRKWGESPPPCHHCDGFGHRKGVWCWYCKGSGKASR